MVLFTLPSRFLTMHFIPFLSDITVFIWDPLFHEWRLAMFTICLFNGRLSSKKMGNIIEIESLWWFARKKCAFLKIYFEFNEIVDINRIFFKNHKYDHQKYGWKRWNATWRFHKLHVSWRNLMELMSNCLRSKYVRHIRQTL